MNHHKTVPVTELYVELQNTPNNIRNINTRYHNTWNIPKTMHT